VGMLISSSQVRIFRRCAGRESPNKKMSNTLRGADVVARSLCRIGCRRIFTLSGNHIMSIFDAALDAGIDLVHVRHEAAAVHMADAHGRLTGEAGVALVTGGPGHANAVGALYTALAAESPMVLLSGHAATWEIGRGGFQELRQSEMAKPVTKASWTAGSVETLGRDIGEAIHLVRSGRRGPVHLSLPSDLLDARLDESAVAWPDDGPAVPQALGDADCARILSALTAAKRPIIVAGPQMSSTGGRDLLAKLEAATGAPAIILESPRGLADATLGALPDLAKRADLVVLLGKALDFSLKWAAAPSFAADVQMVAIDPEAELTARAKREKGDALIFACVADPALAAENRPRQASRRYRLARRSPAGCIQPKSFGPCVLSSSAIRKLSSFATTANSRSGARACSRSGAVSSTASPARSAARSPSRWRRVWSRARRRYSRCSATAR
jgi:acetolactate synthase-1/2/3 large subunit